MADWSKYLEKTAGTPFLEQDRPAKVKEVYSALKRDHPEYSAGKKARIASSMSKSAAIPWHLVQRAAKSGTRTVSNRAGSAGSTAFSASSALPKKEASAAALDVLYAEYGPPKEKHAAANYFFYAVNKDERDVEALGAPFCKLAVQSDMDPWDMAHAVIAQYDNFEKLAGQVGAAGDLARFYMDWADEIEKRAGPIDALLRGGRALKAGVGAMGSSSAKMNRAVQASKAGKAIPKSQGVGQAMKGSLQETKALQQAGGGNLRRGEALAAKDPGLMKATTGPLHPGTPPAAVGGGGAQFSPQAQKAVQGAPPAAMARSATPAAQEPLTAGISKRDLLIGGGVMSGLGLGTGAMTMGGGQPQPQYQGG